MNNSPGQEKIKKFYDKEADIQEDDYQIWLRPNVSKITKQLMIKYRDKAEIGVWSCQDKENTERQVKAIFGKTFTQLMFVFYSPHRHIMINSPPSAIIDPIPIKRDLEIVFNKYSLYNMENTVMISNFKNEIEDFQSNDIVLPVYDPLKGTTDFLDDKHMSFLEKYLHGLYAMDTYTGMDVRTKLRTITYEKFIQKLTKKMRYDSYDYGKTYI